MLLNFKGELTPEEVLTIVAMSTPYGASAASLYRNCT